MLRANILSGWGESMKT
jgi:hypothetical protein